MKINVKSTKIIDSNVSALDLLTILAKNRGITDLSTFLKPKFPVLKLSLTPAVKLIKQHKNILIYGDYDVDGITATAILWQALTKNGAKVTPFIPDRQIDGYGFKAQSFFRFQTEKNSKFDLLITVDNGIVADAEYALVKAKQDIKIIVTDHHLPNGELKNIDHLVHSTKISGAAVSWFLAKKFDSDADLGLAALGTVADCLPLIGVNRSIVVHGLQSLRLNPSPGIKKLMTVSGINPNELSAGDLGFILGPRINAVGRLSNPTDALRLLCSQNTVQATKYAVILDDYNKNRQELQKESLDIAQKNLDLSNKVIFVSGNYNPGIIGLIAGRLTEKHYLPSIIISVDGDIAKGSCRSIASLNIIESLRQFPDLFIDLGGHAGAAGFSIFTKNIPKLKSKIIKLVNQQLKDYLPTPSIDIDAEMTLSAANLTNIKAITKLAPFGIGNPEPLFLFKNVEIMSKRVIGSNGDHLKLKLGNLDAIAFKKADLDKTLAIGGKIDIVAKIDSNTWNNVTLPQLIVKEILKV